jgi:hypothetical protein
MASSVKDRAEWLGGKVRAVHLRDTAHLTGTVTEHAGPWFAKIREAAPKVARKQGTRAKDVAGEHPKGVLVAAITAFGVFVMARLRRMRHASSPRKSRK